MFRRVFNTIVEQCISESLVKGEGFAIDASLIRADASRQRASDRPIDWGSQETQNLAVKEYLAALDEQSDLNRPQKSVSLTDPMSQWSGAKGPAEFYYSTNYLIDVENNIVIDVEASPSTLKLEVATTRTMINRVEENHGLLSERLMGDTAYGAAANLDYLVNEKDIEPHIPVWDKSKRNDGTLSVSDFKWDETTNEYRCPQDKPLRHRWRNYKPDESGITKSNTMAYRSRQSDCKDCPLKVNAERTTG